MDARQRQLEVYESSPGASPFDDWLDRLRDLKGKAVIDVRVRRLEAGNFGDCFPVGEGVRELRIDFGPGYRVYFAEHGPRIILLLLCGDKSSQARDIRLAKENWQIFKERVRNERKRQKL